MSIPPVNTFIPEGNIGWIWGTYTNALLDSIEAHTETTGWEIDNIWAYWGREEIVTWSPSFDLIASFGYSNPLADFRKKELEYYKTLSGKLQLTLNESIRTKNLRLYLTTRLEIEKNRQDAHVTSMTLYAKYAESLIQAERDRYDAELKAMDGSLTRAKAQLDTTIGLVDQVERRLSLAIRLLDAEGDVKIASSRNDLARLRASVEIARAALEFRRAEIDIERASVNKQLTEAEIVRMQAELELKAASVQLEEGRQKEIQADIIEIQARESEINVLRQRLATITHGTALLVSLANTKATAFDTILNQKKDIVEQLGNVLSKQISAEQGYIAAEESVGSAELQLEYTKGNVDMAEISAEGQSRFYRMSADLFVDSVQKYIDAARFFDQLTKEAKQADSEASVTGAKKTASSILKDQKVTNIITEVRE